jgi:hypothetical protein
MTTLNPPDPKKVMQQNLAFLREYARRVIVGEDDSLSPLEDIKEALVQEVWQTGQAFRLTERDLVLLLYKGVLPEYC